MDVPRLQELHALAAYHKVAVLEGKLVGFLLAMSDAAAYRNDNFEWFAARYPRFVYVDRIVISADSGGRGLGGKFYADLFDFARDQGASVVSCEINLEPPNEISAAFHRKWGFSEVGTQRVANDSKLVSLQVATL